MRGAPHSRDDHDVTLPSDNVWEIASATNPAINPVFDVTAELSMKAPMSVSKLADLG